MSCGGVVPEEGVGKDQKNVDDEVGAEDVGDLAGDHGV